MKLNKYSVTSNKGSAIGSFSSTKKTSTSSATTSITSLDRNIWGQEDDGSDIDGDLICGGNMFVVTSLGNDEDDEDEDKTSEESKEYEGLEDIFDDTEGGNLWVEKNLKAGKAVEADSVFGKESFLAYPDKNGDKTNILDLFKMIMPIGSIIMHNGSYTKEELLKYGWAICDGTNGTPNLIGKFVKADSYDKIGTTGGQDSVTLTTANLPSHSHTATTTINLNIEQDSPSIKTEWKDQKIITYKETYYQVFDMGGDKHYTAETGYESSQDKGIVEIDVEDLLLAAGGVSGSASASTTIGSTGSGTAFDNQPAFYSLIYIMRIK